MVHDILWLLDPKLAKKYEDAERAQKVSSCKEAGLVDWKDVTGFRPYMYLDAKSFMKAENHLLGVKLPIVIDEKTNLRIATKLLPKEMILQVVSGSRRGYICFDENIRIPRLVVEQYGMDDIWMSISPNEILTQRPGVRRTRGHTVIAGLGMGWSLWKIAQRKQVRQITVIEKDPRILDVVKDLLIPLLESMPDPKPVTWICGDMYTVLKSLTNVDTLFADIWMNYGSAEGETKKLREKFPDVKSIWCWGDVYVGPSR